jgi:hypothetical protein
MSRPSRRAVIERVVRMSSRWISVRPVSARTLATSASGRVRPGATGIGSDSQLGDDVRFARHRHAHRPGARPAHDLAGIDPGDRGPHGVGQRDGIDPEPAPLRRGRERDARPAHHHAGVDVDHAADPGEQRRHVARAPLQQRNDPRRRA